MKLENCGRCGLEPYIRNVKEAFVFCPVHYEGRSPADWNRDQFRDRTERINAAALAICTGQKANDSFEGDVLDAEELIEMEDARARVRWAEMQKGE